MMKSDGNLMTNQSRSGEFTGWHMLAIMVAFFGVIIGVNVFMATSAFRSWTGLVVQNSYVASQEFNEKLTASREQAALNWDVNLHYEAGSLGFMLYDDLGEVVEPESVQIALTRPIGVTEDRVLDLQRGATGFAIENDIPDGIWNAEITAIINGYPPFIYRARLLVGDE